MRRSDGVGAAHMLERTRHKPLRPKRYNVASSLREAPPKVLTGQPDGTRARLSGAAF